jgi:C_GCAxxG_C_C family probable redox protein
MNRKEKAVHLFRQQFNCSQSVFTAYRQAGKMDEETALKLASVFGAGIACTGNGMCGAVTGALMAISMKHGRGDLKSAEEKEKTYSMGKKFMSDFAGRTGSCDCEKILGMNIGTPENLKKANEMNLFGTKCLHAVKAAADILESII